MGELTAFEKGLHDQKKLRKPNYLTREGKRGLTEKRVLPPFGFP